MAATPGFGTKFHYGNVGATYTALATGWTALGDVISIKLPEDKVKDINTTTFDQTSNVMSSIGGMVEGGEGEIIVHYSATVQAALKAIRGSAHLFRVMFPDASGNGYPGYISGTPVTVDIDGLVGLACKFKVTGDYTAITAIA